MYVFVMGRENGCYTESGSWNQTIGNQKSKAASLCVCVLGFFLCVFLVHKPTNGIIKIK